MIVSISETFLTDFNTIRRELFLKTNSSEKIIVSEAFWNIQSDKKEVLIKGMYYDIKSFKQIKNQFVLHAIPDKFDSIFKKLTENLNKKHKLIKSNKSINFLPLTEFQLVFSTNELNSKNNFSVTSILKNKVVVPFFRPPNLV
jgi:hypothetical protein